MSVADSHLAQELESSLAGIFPLPLTPLESFMIADARADYPMLCDLELHFAGSIDRGAFDAALGFAIARNPLFRALVAQDERGKQAWILSDQLPWVDWSPLGTPIGDRYDTFLDLRVETGLRIWVREGVERSTVLLHFHHACADGMGGFAFIEDFLAGYANAYGQQPAIVPRPLEPQRLKQRGESKLERQSFGRALVGALVGITESVRFVTAPPRPLPLCTGGVAASQPSAPFGFVSQSCSEEVAAGVRQAAARAGTTVNDVLLRDLFVTLRDWHALTGPDQGRCRLRILMPQNLREREDRTLPAANVMSFAFLSRHADHCAQPDKLLDSIRRETEAIRRDRLSICFLGTLAAGQQTGIQDWALSKSFCFTTAVLTNLGDPTRRFVARFPRCSTGLVAGNLVLEQMTGGAPLRPLTRAAFSVFNSARTLTVSLRCDRHGYTQSDAKRLLELYLAQLRSTAERAGKATG